MIKDLIKLASHLDSKGYHKEADYVDSMIKRASPSPISTKILPVLIGTPLEPESPAGYDENKQLSVYLQVAGVRVQIGTYFETYGKEVEGRPHRFVPLPQYEDQYPAADDIPLGASMSSSTRASIESLYNITKRGGDAESKTPKLKKYIKDLESVGWTVNIGEVNVSETLARCTDGTNNCNKKTLWATGSATMGSIDEDSDGSEALIDIRYMESWYKEPK